MTDLKKLDEQYDPSVKLLGYPAATPGYHTRIKDGTYVHHTRESLDYALACLIDGEAMRVRRAHDIIEKILSLQDINPLSPTFGIWSWFYEEPLAMMNPPDWNWADFLGARIAQMLVLWRGRLDASLAAKMLLTVDRAAMAIFRRNSPVAYTNIAIMGAGVCAAAGELLDKPVLLQYGQNKLQAVLDLAKKVGAFSEYNSPTYTLVAVEECERILVMTSDQPMHAVAQQLLAVAWKMIAEHWHQPTNQWAGPHGRAYSDRLGEAQLGRIESAIGRRLTGRENLPATSSLQLIPERPCPAELVPLFIDPIKTPRSVSTDLGSTAEGVSKIGYTWLAPTFALASANRDSSWHQRRAVLGSWCDGKEIAIFKTQWLMDGRDMPAMRFATSQTAGRLLFSLYPMHGTGPFHPGFDAPADHTFTASDFRLRFSVSGPSAKAHQISATRFDLAAGDHHVLIDIAPSTFDGQPIKWAIHQENQTAMLDAICLDATGQVNFKTLKISLAAGIQLLQPNEQPISSDVRIDTDGDHRLISWPTAGVETLRIPIDAAHAVW